MLPATSAKVDKAVLLLGFYGMLRSKEFLQASAKNLAWSWNKKGQLTFKSQFADKTHLSKDRKVLVPVNSGWEQAASALIVRAKVKRTLRTHQILEPKERAAIKLALKKVKSSPGCIRPGGNMYWLQRGLSKALIHKQGGWAPNSSIPSRHYTSMNKWAQRQLRKASSATTF